MPFRTALMTQRRRLCLRQTEQRHGLSDFKKALAGKAKPYRTLLRQSRGVELSVLCILILGAVFLGSSCSQGVRRSGMPAGAQTVLDTSIADIDAGRYDKLYHEAADEWRNDTTLDESKATFQKLRDRLGKVRTRDQQSVREERTSTAPIAGHSVIVIYQTVFDQGTGMETFTLLERGGQWYLARYYVTSNALK